jgi:hypothetical protein
MMYTKPGVELPRRRWRGIRVGVSSPNLLSLEISVLYLPHVSHLWGLIIAAF